MNRLKTRIFLYDLLRSAFYPPDLDRAAEVVDGRFSESLERVVQECPRVETRCCFPSELMREIRALPLPLEERGEAVAREVLTALEVEYMRLFVNDFPTHCAPPYESCYREGRVMGRAALDCLSIYESEGLVLTDTGELPDHIVTQLEYLQWLCLAERQMWEENDQSGLRILRIRERDFYDEHLLPWVPEFCERIRSCGRVPYYRVMARLLKNFAVMERRNLNCNLDDEERDHEFQTI